MKPALIKTLVLFGFVLAAAVMQAQPQSDDSPETATFQTPVEISLPPRAGNSLGSSIEFMKELLAILTPYSRSNSSLEVSVFPEIKRGVTLMMPLKEALQKLGINQLSPNRQAIAFPGLPFYYRLFTNPEKDGFNSLYIVTDAADRVVALQYVNESPKDINFYAPAEENIPKDLLSYNFVNFRKRATRTLEVRVSVLCRDDSSALPITNLETRKDELKLQRDESEARRTNSRQNTLLKTETTIASVKQRIEFSEKQIAALRQQIADLQKEESSEKIILEISKKESELRNQETLIFNHNTQLASLEKKLEELSNKPIPTKERNSTDDAQEILCIQTVLFDQKKFRNLEIVKWYLPRRIAEYVQYNLRTQLGERAN